MVTYTNTNIKGHEGKVITVHEDFVPVLDRMNSFAHSLGITVWVTSSLRHSTLVPGAIVPPAKMSNHLVGHAIDANLQIGSVWYNSKMLASPTGIVLDFILQCEASHIRWGGRFSTPDPVHFDSGLNVLHPERWKEIYEGLDKG
jgi:hypothetical protein